VEERTMGIVAWIVVGAIAGFLANLIVGGGEGLIGTIILGIVGGLIGGFAATQIFHVGSVDGLDVESVLIATAGAIVVLFVWHLFTSRSTGRVHL
jgi:uncharacterized membrane protein YeaQ/YmgE (transglycosylase-associated protein family)